VPLYSVEESTKSPFSRTSSQGTTSFDPVLRCFQPYPVLTIFDMYQPPLLQCHAHTVTKMFETKKNIITFADPRSEASSSAPMPVCSGPAAHVAAVTAPPIQVFFYFYQIVTFH
jgi:hypothetical protein